MMRTLVRIAQCHCSHLPDLAVDPASIVAKIPNTDKTSDNGEVTRFVLYSQL